MTDKEYHLEQRRKSEAYQVFVKDVWLKAFPLMQKQQSKYVGIGDKAGRLIVFELFQPKNSRRK